jgi:luciferase family oxidoreductase group 1
MTKSAASRLRLSVLDQSPISEGSTLGAALKNSIDLAVLAESMGYHRYWVAEHHGSPGFGCMSPEILIGLIAAATSRIRVGSGGVMLPHYSPFKVAESFSMLASLFPGRIDLGVGRASGTDRKTALALQRDRRLPAADDFPDQLVELISYCGTAEQRRDQGTPQANLVTHERPHLWLLGSSTQSAVWAADLGLSYAFADFINAHGGEDAVTEHYREQFTPRAKQPKPETAVAVWAICAETDAEANLLASSFKMLILYLQRGELIAVPSPQKAARFLAERAKRADSLPMQRRIVVGTPEVVKNGIEAIAAEYEADEVLIVNIVYDHAARKRSYQLIADAFGLAGAWPLYAMNSQGGSCL